MTTYALGSSSFVYTPGIVRWAINGYAFKKDRAKLRRVFTDGYGVPDKAVDALLSGKVPYTLKGEKGSEAVVFTYGKFVVAKRTFTTLQDAKAYAETLFQTKGIVAAIEEN